MSIASLEDWEEALGGDPLLDLLADKDAPASFDAAYADEEWRRVFHRFAMSERCEENLDFMADVEDFDLHPTGGEAIQIYANWIQTDRVNIDSSTKADIEKVMSGEVEKPLNDYFKAAYSECWQLMKHGTYRSFVTAAATARIDIGKVDHDGAQAANQKALKSLEENATTSFWQEGDIVLIDGASHPRINRMAIERARGLRASARGDQPNGVVKMVSKGGLTSSGKILVTGCTNREAFREQVADFSKKEVVFA
jgi:Regulator of G protein signaling domain